MTIRIVLADDHQLFRQGIRNLFEQEEDIEVIGEASDGREMVEKVLELRPDVLVTDISMPNLNGIDATRQLIADNPELAILALSMHSEHQFISEMLNAGASGYLLKECPFDELVHAVRVVYRKKTYLSPDIASTLVNDFRLLSKNQSNSKMPALSAREREVLQLIAEGHPTKQIAANLNVSVKTIETHRAQIMKKLNTSSLAELIKYAIRIGLTSL